MGKGQKVCASDGQCNRMTPGRQGSSAVNRSSTVTVHASGHVSAKEPRTKRLVPQHQPRSKWNGLGEVTTLGGSERIPLTPPPGPDRPGGYVRGSWNTRRLKTISKAADMPSVDGCKKCNRSRWRSFPRWRRCESGLPAERRLMVAVRFSQLKGPGHHQKPLPRQRSLVIDRLSIRGAAEAEPHGGVDLELDRVHGAVAEDRQ